MQEQIAAEVARQVAEQLAATQVAAATADAEVTRQAAEPLAAEKTADAADTEVALQVAEPLVAEKTAAAQAAPAPVTAAPSPAQAGSSTLATPAPAPAAKVYAIGDTGPRGGIVFSNSDGKYKEITKPENAGGISAALPAGWKLASMPELMQVYTTLRGKADFGDIWYRSSSTWNRTPSGSVGTDYTRDHATLTPGSMSDYDKTRIFFPDAHFILAFGGTPPTEYFIRFTDGKIIGGGTEDGSYWYAFDGSGIVLDDAKCLYVREF
jgi:glucan-binding YG repeat protein